jgi:hypothetical protein
VARDDGLHQQRRREKACALAEHAVHGGFDLTTTEGRQGTLLAWSAANAGVKGNRPSEDTWRVAAEIAEGMCVHGHRRVDCRNPDDPTKPHHIWERP